MWEITKNHNWYVHRDDPDNWLEIPEFNIAPKEVDYLGFKKPILGWNCYDFEVKIPMQESVQVVRSEARKRFTTLQALKDQLSLTYQSDEMLLDEVPESWTDNMVFAVRYDLYFFHLNRCLVGLRKKKGESLGALAQSMKLAVDIFSAKKIDAAMIKKIRTEMGKEGGAANLQNNIKQKEKQLVRECWEEWKKQPVRYTSAAAFARDMLDKYENLKSQVVIARWCRDWEAGI